VKPGKTRSFFGLVHFIPHYRTVTVFFGVLQFSCVRVQSLSIGTTYQSGDTGGARRRRIVILSGPSSSWLTSIFA
jgi:hypothetical protein